MELGITSFAETTAAPATGRAVDSATRLADLMEEIKLADEVGLDVYAVGEHHRPDFAVSSPAVVLGAAAVVTERIRPGSAVTVLSTDDPVRVFEDFAGSSIFGHCSVLRLGGSGHAGVRTIGNVRPAFFRVNRWLLTNSPGKGVRDCSGDLY